MNDERRVRGRECAERIGPVDRDVEAPCGEACPDSREDGAGARSLARHDQDVHPGILCPNSIRAQRAAISMLAWRGSNAAHPA
jgi:hypothetical protein